MIKTKTMKGEIYYAKLTVSYVWILFDIEDHNLREKLELDWLSFILNIKKLLNNMSIIPV